MPSWIDVPEEFAAWLAKHDTNPANTPQMRALSAGLRTAT